MIIPYEKLSEEAFTGLIEEFVSREGTDYGGVHVALADKVAAVRKQLASGKVVVVFDRVEERANIVTADSVANKGGGAAPPEFRCEADPAAGFGPAPDLYIDPDPYDDC